MADPIQLTPAQKARALAFLQNPANQGRGYKAALDAAGIAYGNTSARAKATIQGDPDLAEAWNDARLAQLEACGLGEAQILSNVGRLAGNLDHKDALRANTWAAAVLHGMSEQQRLELTGPEGGPMEVSNPDVADAVQRFTEIADRAVRNAATDGA